MKKLTTDEFIERAIKVHGNKYDYSKVEYINNKKRVEIYCNTCKKYFKQRPDNHLHGAGCPYCGCKITHNKLKLNNDIFINKAQKIHGKEKYNYDKIKYIDYFTKVEIYCNTCKKYFWQYPSAHYKGCGCPYCVGFNKTTNDIIKEFQIIHGLNYDYSEVEYISACKKVKIKCNKCGQNFYQTPNHHLKGRGCPYCKNSHGEEKIKLFLENNNIIYDFQKRFNDCRDKQVLPFDFYLPSYNVCIEYQGQQHYKQFYKFRKDIQKGHKALKLTQYHDQIKRDYCKANNITLIEIKYNENIEEKLKLLLLKN